MDPYEQLPIIVTPYTNHHAGEEASIFILTLIVVAILGGLIKLIIRIAFEVAILRSTRLSRFVAGKYYSIQI